MRIGFVTQWFPPEPSVVSAGITDGLAQRGHTVDVITGFPNYPTGILYDGYQEQGYRSERRSTNVTVYRCPLYPSHDARAVNRIRNYLSFGASACRAVRNGPPRPDVWLVYYGPATAALPSILAPRRMTAPVCHMIQDLWPESVTESEFVSGPVGLAVKRVLDVYCGWTYRRAAGLGVISPGAREVLVRRGVPQEKIHYTPNWIDDSHLFPWSIPDDASRRAIGLPLGPLFMYAGNIGAAQGLGPLIEAFGLCPEVTLVLIGDGVERAKLQQQTCARNARNVVFLGARPIGEIGRYIAASDVQIVSLRDSELYRVTMPSKVAAVLAASRPVLAHAAGDAARLITTCGAGLAVQPGDIGEAVTAIRKLAALQPGEAAALGAAGRAYYEQHFSPDVGLDHLERMLRHCAGVLDPVDRSRRSIDSGVNT